MPHPPHRAVWHRVPNHLSAIHIGWFSSSVAHVYFFFENQIFEVDKRSVAVLVRSLEDHFPSRVFGHCLAHPADSQTALTTGHRVIFERGVSSAGGLAAP